jgi:hypothetical protein
MQFIKYILFFLSFFITLPSAFADSFSDTFMDPVDQQLDMSNWLLEKKGFLPVAIVITEPAVGYGGGLGMVYFHDKFGGQDGKPSVSAIAAAGTENGTWFVGGGHLGIWKDDTIRYVGGAGVGRVKMQYYGILSDEPIGSELGINFDMDVAFLMQEIQFRLGNSDFFAGASCSIADTSSAFSPSSAHNNSLLPEIEMDTRSAALNLILTYDSRNSMFSPDQGIVGKLKASSYNELWGGDNNYWYYNGNIAAFKKVHPDWLVSSRFAGKAITGDEAPFYAYPFIDMRGVKVMQYQGDQIAQAELEISWQFTRRWSILAFGGAAKAFAEPLKGNSDVIYSKGTGFRYLIASKLDLQMGLDLAFGPDDTAVYIQVGNAWSLK